MNNEAAAAEINTCSLFDLFLFVSSDKHCLFLKVQLWSTRASENLQIGSSHPASFLGFEQCSELHFSIFLHVSSLEMLQLHRRRTEHSKWNTNNCRIASASPVSQQHILRPVNTPTENTDRPDVNTVTASHPEAPGTEEQTDSLTKQKWFHCALKGWCADLCSQLPRSAVHISSGKTWKGMSGIRRGSSVGLLLELHWRASRLPPLWSSSPSSFVASSSCVSLWESWEWFTKLT